MRRLRRGFAAAVAGVALAVIAAGPVAAHEHFAEDAHGGTGQVLANSQNHPRPFVAIGDGTYSSCESFSPGGAFGPAWYGVETAHHGPDSGDPGKADRCYVADGNPALGEDDQNPAIR
jgi:hypothetical protein